MISAGQIAGEGSDEGVKCVLKMRIFWRLCKGKAWARRVNGRSSRGLRRRPFGNVLPLARHGVGSPFAASC